MRRWWKEVWSAGSGPSRTYCGIARTVDGYAVDLFRGDSCLASEIHGTRAEAERAAAGLSRGYIRRGRASGRVDKARTAWTRQESRPRAVA